MSKKVLLLWGLLLLFFYSCSNDEQGVSISFANPPTDISVYSVCNEKVPICEVTMRGKSEITISLNEGNYIVLPYSKSHFYEKVGFSVTRNEITSIKYDSKNIGEVQR